MPGILAMGLAYFFSQFYRACLAVMSPWLSVDLGVDASDLGQASGAWFLVFAAMQLPVGVSLDRLGPRRTSGLIFGICGAGGSALFALAQGPATLTLAMALLGAGCAPALMSMIYVFARRYDPARFATLTSVTVGVATLGNVAGTEPFALLIEAIGWRASMAAFAVVSALAALAILALVKDPPRVEAAADERPDRGFLEYFQLLRLPIFWPILAMAFIAYTPYSAVRGLWAGPFLTDLHAATAAEVGRATLYMALAMTVGAFFYGPLDRVFGTRKWVIASGNATAALCCFAVAWTAGADALTSTVLMACVGFFGATYSVTMTHAKALAPVRLVGRTVTMMNLFIMSGTGIGLSLSGRFVAAAFDSGAPAQQAYSQLFWLFGGAMLLATFIYLFSRDARP